MHNAVPFPIVGIGASAGGVQALQAFFRGLPENPGMAFVVVTHMNPDRESMLAEILAHHTSLPVIPANDCVQVKQNHVYVMPSDAVLTIRDRTLIAGKIDRVSRERKPVDVFFASLAKDQGESAVAIILSGGDGDGTLGAKAIREAGGLTIAQASDGSSPQYPGMAFVVVKHMNPDRESMLAEILARHTYLTVIQKNDCVQDAKNKI